MNSKELNNNLLQVQDEWERALLVPFLEKFSKEEVSRPFCFGVSDKTLSAKHKIMIIGQQTHRWNSYQSDIEWSLNSIQSWGVEFLERQIWGLHSDELEFLPSPFWNFFRKIEEEGWGPCWNNLDKVQRVKAVVGTDELTLEQEKLLNRAFTNDGKTLLQKEIELSKPDRVVFIVGPRYIDSLSVSLCLPMDELTEYRPTKSTVCTDISAVAGLDIPVFWTYHPNYLNYIKRIEECVSLTTRSIIR